MLQGIFRIISRAQSGASFWFRKPRTWCGSTHGCTSHQPCRHCKFLTPQCDAIHSPGPLMSGHEGVHQRIRGLLSQLQPLAARQEAVRYVWAARCQVPAGMKTKGHALILSTQLPIFFTHCVLGDLPPACIQTLVMLQSLYRCLLNVVSGQDRIEILTTRRRKLIEQHEIIFFFSPHIHEVLTKFAALQGSIYSCGILCMEAFDLNGEQRFKA